MLLDFLRSAMLKKHLLDYCPLASAGCHGNTSAGSRFLVKEQMLVNQD